MRGGTTTTTTNPLPRRNSHETGRAELPGSNDLQEKRTVITLRLSDYRSAAVEFSATDPISLRRGCHSAWRAFTALVAQRPGYFEATTEFNQYSAHLASALTADGRAERVARWAALGKSPAEIERLWENFQRDSSARLKSARRRLQEQLAPESLSLQLRPELYPAGSWLNPGNHVHPRWWSPSTETNWTQLWADVVKMHDHDKNLSGLCSFVAASLTPPTPEARRRSFCVVDGNDPSAPV